MFVSHVMFLAKLHIFCTIFLSLVRAYCVIDLFVALIHWYGLKWSDDDRDELNVFKSASFFRYTEQKDLISQQDQ